MFLFSMESTDYAEDGGSNTDMVKGILGILSIFVFGYMLISKETKFESKELTKNGKYTTAVIVDGSVLRSRRNTSHQLKVRYKNEAGEVHTSKVLVSPAQYDRSYIGMKIPIIYSPSYPDMVRIEFQKVNFNQVPAY
ncbi:MAG: hypothetical protein JJ975_02360 [Bacteroidia bacterium]|nr:hypothetical protein [Bacteroidia bacterium]